MAVNKRTSKKVGNIKVMRLGNPTWAEISEIIPDNSEQERVLDAEVVPDPELDLVLPPSPPIAVNGGGGGADEGGEKGRK
jgi:hypothetical protein